MSTLGDATDVKSGKYQDTECFLIPCPRHVSSRLPPSGKTRKYTTAPSTHTHKLGEILYLLIRSFLLCLSWLLCSRVRKFRRDLWITLYIHVNTCMLRTSMRRSNFSDVRHVRKTAFPIFIPHTHPTARLKGKTWQNQKRRGNINKKCSWLRAYSLVKTYNKEERKICEVLRFSQRSGWGLPYFL